LRATADWDMPVAQSASMQRTVAGAEGVDEREGATDGLCG